MIFLILINLLIVICHLNKAQGLENCVQYKKDQIWQYKSGNYFIQAFDCQWLHIVNNKQTGVLSQNNLNEKSIELAGKKTSFKIFDNMAIKKFKSNSTSKELTGTWTSPSCSGDKYQLWKSQDGQDNFKNLSDCNWIYFKNNKLVRWFDNIKLAQYDPKEGHYLDLSNYQDQYHYKIFDKKFIIYDSTKRTENVKSVGEWILSTNIISTGSEETVESVCDYKKGMIWESKPGFYFKQNSDCEWFEFRDNIEYKIFESSNLTHHKLYLHTTDYTVIIDEKEALGPDYSLKGEWIKEPTMFSTITTTALSATSMPLKKKMSFLYPGEFLIVGDYLESENGHYKAVMQLDGNFVVYGIGEKVWWASNTLGNADRLTMQHGGNLVLSKGDTVTWTSGTQRIGSHLVMQNDGNLVVYSRGGPAVWASRKDEQVDENEVNKPHVVKMKIPTYRRAWVTDDPYYKFMIKEEDDKSWSTYFDQKLYCSWYLVSSNGYHNVKLQLSKIYDPVAQWDFNPLLIYEIMEKTLITRNRKSGDVIVKGYWI